MKTKNMTLSALGDSITLGTYYKEAKIPCMPIARNNYIRIISKYFAFENTKNYAINSVCVSSTANVVKDWALCRLYNAVSPDSNVILIAAGTNDYAQSVKLGDFDDKSDVSFYGALNVLIGGLKERHKNATILYLSPLHRKKEDENKGGYTLADYKKAIVKVCESYDVTVIDGFDLFDFAKDEKTIKKYLNDGIHPNIKGHRVLAKALIKRLEKILDK